VEEYWSAKQGDNFARFCHPMRTGARVKRREVQSSIHLLDLKKIVEKITIVKQFKERCKRSGDEEKFERIYNDFLRNLCRHCGYSLEDLYFEDCQIVLRNVLFVEVTPARPNLAPEQELKF